jgi:hypothetical protein
MKSAFGTKDLNEEIQFANETKGKNISSTSKSHHGLT